MRIDVWLAGCVAIACFWGLFIGVAWFTVEHPVVALVAGLIGATATGWAWAGKAGYTP